MLSLDHCVYSSGLHLNNNDNSKSLIKFRVQYRWGRSRNRCKILRSTKPSTFSTNENCMKIISFETSSIFLGGLFDLGWYFDQKRSNYEWTIRDLHFDNIKLSYRCNKFSNRCVDHFATSDAGASNAETLERDVLPDLW